DLHPKKAVRRRNSLQYIIDQAKDHFEAVQLKKPGAEERRPLEAALASVTALQVITKRELEDQVPIWSGLTTPLNERIRYLPPPEEPAEPAAAPEVVEPEAMAEAPATNGTTAAPAPTPESSAEKSEKTADGGPYSAFVEQLSAPIPG